jgi:NAD(P) transhydrogenase
MFGGASMPHASLLPYGIYTIPEIAMVGQTEEQLTVAAIPLEQESPDTKN